MSLTPFFAASEPRIYGGPTRSIERTYLEIQDMGAVGSSGDFLYGERTSDGRIAKMSINPSNFPAQIAQLSENSDVLVAADNFQVHAYSFAQQQIETFNASTMGVEALTNVSDAMPEGEGMTIHNDVLYLIERGGLYLWRYNASGSRVGVRLAFEGGGITSITNDGTRLIMASRTANRIFVMQGFTTLVDYSFTPPGTSIKTIFHDRQNLYVWVTAPNGRIYALKNG